MDYKMKTKVGNKIVKHGAKGYWIGRKGSPKQKSYCARSLGIAIKYSSARLWNWINILWFLLYFNWVCDF
jgi:hypothetical protein